MMRWPDFSTNKPFNRVRINKVKRRGEKVRAHKCFLAVPLKYEGTMFVVLVENFYANKKACGLVAGL
jgi:hypothetical protein